MAKYVLMAKDELGHDVRVGSTKYEFPTIDDMPLQKAFWAYEHAIIEELRDLEELSVEWYDFHLELDYTSVPAWKLRELWEDGVL